MPTIFRILGFRFFFYSNEGTEPPHVHVEKGDSQGKVWLDPLEESDLSNFKSKEQRKILDITKENQSTFKSKWYGFFGTSEDE